MNGRTRVYDIVGIGIGPFNLGLAALSDPVNDVDAVFLDTADEFRWHPGMMIEGATIQVPFLADLVTMADPTSPYSFLNYLKRTGRLYQFYIRESFHPLRTEFEQYCRWVAQQLNTLRWGRHVTEVEHDEDGGYLVRATHTPTGSVEEYRARHVVVGIGTAPNIPATLSTNPGPLVHSSNYLHERHRLRAAASVTIVGSGQSAAEIYRDLLQTGNAQQQLDWITRSPRFFPMEYTKLSLELTSPEYTDHFHALPMQLRDQLSHEQRNLHKGISSELIDDIYNTLYRQSIDGPTRSTLLTDTTLLSAQWCNENQRFTLALHHEQLGSNTHRTTEAVILATGYAPRDPKFLTPLGDTVARDSQGRLDVARNYSIDHGNNHLFVQNAEEHTHGLTAPDLGFAAWRNSSILASITGRETYPIERRIAFQQFGLPADDHTHHPHN